LSSRTIDRESACEILGAKIKTIEKQAAEKAAREETEKQKKEGSVIKPSRRTTTRRRTATSPVVKVLTSATFIRGVMAILSKVMK